MGTIARRRPYLRAATALHIGTNFKSRFKLEISLRLCLYRRKIHLS